MNRETFGLIIEALLDGPKDWKSLKEKTGLSDGTLAKYLKKMLEKGYIEEEVSKIDRRKKIYKLLPNEKVFETSIEKFIAKTFLYYIRELFENEYDDRYIERVIGRFFLDLLFGGEKGHRIGKMIFENFERIKSEIDGEKRKKYEKSFDETWNELSKIVKDWLEKEIKIDLNKIDPKKYRIWIELDE